MRRVTAEKPLFWIGSSREDLLVFPEAVKDEMGTALTVAQFGGKHPKAKPWKGEGPGYSKLSKTLKETLTGRFTRSDLKVSFTYFTFSKRNCPTGYERQKGTLT
jgi:phage-related protein